MEKIKKKIKNYFSNGPKAIFVIGAVLITVSIITLSMKKTIIVSIDGKEYKKISTFKNTYRDALSANDISLGSKDKVTPSLDKKVEDGTNLKIKKAVKVNVEVDGKKLAIKSAEDNVGNMLQSEKIKLKQSDKVYPKEDTPIKNGLNVSITRIETKVLKETKNMDYEVVTKDDSSLERGAKKVIQDGQNGEKEVSTEVVYENGKEKARKIVAETVKKKPVAKVVAVGTMKSDVAYSGINPSRGGSVSQKSLRMRATAYTSSYEDTGKRPGSSDFGITATGTTAKRNCSGYSSVAVDPRVIPLGTKLYIEGYGYAIAEDTGGAIKGNVIDLYFNSKSEVDNWGSRWVNVYIID